MNAKDKKIDILLSIAFAGTICGLGTSTFAFGVATPLIVFQLAYLVIMLAFANHLSKEFQQSYNELTILKDSLQEQVELKTAELRKTNKQLALEKEYKANLLVNAAHELKTPHTVLKSSLYRLGELYPEVKKSEQFRIVAQEMESIVSDAVNILDETRFDGQEIVYEHNRVYSISDQLRHKVKLFREYAAERGLEFEANIPGGVNVRASDEAVNRVLNNVLENAVKFSPPESKIEAILKRGEQFSELSIRDSGPGIPQEELEHLFEKNYQITRDKQVSKGIGLGLYLTNRIISDLGGRVEIDSIEGEGTVVRLLFPVCNERPEEGITCQTELPKRRAAVEVEVSDSEQREGAATILLVEDEPILLKSLKEALQGEYNILTAANGEKALHRLKEHSPDLIMTDIMMPTMNGVDLCKRVSAMESYNHIPFIFLTAKTTERALLEGFEAGAIDYITKPFDLNLVKIRVANNIRVMRLLTENIKLNVGQYFYDDRKKKYREHNITPKQQEYVDLLLDFSTDYNCIAEKMEVTVGGVKSIIHKVGLKIGYTKKREIIDYFS